MPREDKKVLLIRDLKKRIRVAASNIELGLYVSPDYVEKQVKKLAEVRGEQ